MKYRCRACGAETDTEQTKAEINKLLYGRQSPITALSQVTQCGACGSTDLVEISPVVTAAPKRGVPLWAQILVWVALIALLAVVALGLRRAQQGTVQPGDTIPDFTLTLFEGYEYESKGEVKLSELRGKVVVINFWASWCKPCEQEAAEMEAAWRKYQADGQVIFLGADYVDTEPEARGYLQKFEITYPNGPDLGTRISQFFRIKGVPETYFIDQNGKLVYVQVGPFTSEAQIHAIINPLLNK